MSIQVSSQTAAFERQAEPDGLVVGRGESAAAGAAESSPFEVRFVKLEKADPNEVALYVRAILMAIGAGTVVPVCSSNGRGIQVTAPVDLLFNLEKTIKEYDAVGAGFKYPRTSIVGKPFHLHADTDINRFLALLRMFLPQDARCDVNDRRTVFIAAPMDRDYGYLAEEEFLSLLEGSNAKPVITG